MSDYVTLYTTHTLDYCPTIPSDVVKGTAQSLGKDFIYAYQWLYKLLNIRRATWCYDSPLDFSITLGMPMCIYALNVPKKCITAINSDIWWHAYSNCNIYPEYFYDLSDVAFAEATREWDKVHKKEIEWASHIFTKGDHMEYIIPNPIPQEWITQKNIVSGWEQLHSFESRIFSDAMTAQQWLIAALSQCYKLKPYLRIEFNPSQEWYIQLSAKQSIKGTPPLHDHPLLANVPQQLHTFQ